jgi:prepilin-type N-terminal cleavage/methylation domain-containing protein
MTMHRRRPRRGFSLIELLTVMVVIGVLARFGLPRYADMRSQSRARAIAGDIHAIRLASLNYQADQNGWPLSAARGVVPTGLPSYLPTGFTFSKPTGDLEWQVVNLTQHIGGKVVTTQTPQVIVRTTDPKLNAALLMLARQGFAHAMFGTHVAFIIGGGS